MKITVFFLTVFFGLLFDPSRTCTGSNSSEGTVLIYKPDGTKHCDSYHGIAVDVMEKELSARGINVLAKRKGYDSREGIAFCGSPTGQINIYEILTSESSAALNLGFRELPQN